MPQSKKSVKKSSSNYVDGFVLVVPKKRLAEYKKMAQEGAKAWMKFGALEYKECVGDDLAPDMKGMVGLRFPAMIKSKPSEVVLFSFITFKTRAHRDSVNKKVMAYFEKKYGKEATDGEQPDMPFDMKRMAYGGFKVLVSG